MHHAAGSQEHGWLLEAAKGKAQISLREPAERMQALILAS